MAGMPELYTLLSQVDPSDSGINKVLIRKQIQRSVEGSEVGILASILQLMQMLQAQDCGETETRQARPPALALQPDRGDEVEGTGGSGHRLGTRNAGGHEISAEGG